MPETDPAPERDPRPTSTNVGLLAEIAAGLAAPSELGEFLQRFLDPVVKLAGAQAGVVRVLSDDGTQFQAVSTVDLPPDVCARAGVVDRHCGDCGASADNLQVRWVSDLKRCAERAPGTFIAQQCQRMLVVPLQHRGRVLGVCDLYFRDTTEPPADVQAMLRAIGELLGLALNNARLEQAQLRANVLSERQMMAAEVHDSIAQALAFVKMRMPLLQDAMQSRDDAAAARYCQDVRTAVSQAHSSLRAILTHFRAPMDPHGLVHALDASAARFRRATGTDLAFSNTLNELALEPERESQVFHIVQEALANVQRHSAARHASLRLAPTADGRAEIVIEDDGAGLPPQSPEGAHYGLAIMLERARRLDGTLEVGPREGGGTRVRLVFPLPAVAATAGGHG